MAGTPPIAILQESKNAAKSGLSFFTNQASARHSEVSNAWLAKARY
jgi:hypothetical protein